MRWTVLSLALLFGLFASSTFAGPIIQNPPGGPWYEFDFGGPGSFATDGTGTIPSSGGNSIYADSPPWTFTGPALFLITDAFSFGDSFSVFDNNVLVFSTPGVAQGTASISDPDITFPDVAFSSGSYNFGPGNHSITIRADNSPFGGGAAFFRLAAAEVPEPASLALWSILGTAGIAAWRRKRKASAA